MTCKIIFQRFCCLVLLSYGIANAEPEANHKLIEVQLDQYLNDIEQKKANLYSIDDLRSMSNSIKTMIEKYSEENFENEAQKLKDLSLSIENVYFDSIN